MASDGKLKDMGPPKKSDRRLEKLLELSNAPGIDAVSAAKRLKIQEEWCRATGHTFTQPDGAAPGDF